MSVCGLYVSHVEEGEGVLEGEIIQVELCGLIEVAGGGGQVGEVYAMYAKQMMGV